MSSNDCFSFPTFPSSLFMHSLSIIIHEYLLHFHQIFSLFLCVAPTCRISKYAPNVLFMAFSLEVILYDFSFIHSVGKSSFISSSCLNGKRSMTYFYRFFSETSNFVKYIFPILFIPALREPHGEQILYFFIEILSRFFFFKAYERGPAFLEWKITNFHEIYIFQKKNSMKIMTRMENFRRQNEKFNIFFIILPSHMDSVL